jgi:hypothetical protein
LLSGSAIVVLSDQAVVFRRVFGAVSELVFRRGESLSAVADVSLSVRGEEFRHVHDVVGFDHFDEVFAREAYAMVGLHPGFQFFGNV